MEPRKDRKNRKKCIRRREIEVIHKGEEELQKIKRRMRWRDR